MAKDPFNNIPPVVEDTPAPNHGQAAFPSASDADITRGATSKNLLKSVSKVGVPLAGIGILVWMFLPNQTVSVKKANVPDPVVDETRQVRQTNSMIDQMRIEAKKVPPKPAPVVVQAQTGPTPLGGMTPAGQPPQPASPLALGSAYADPEKVRAEAQKRLEDIRSSSLTAGSFKLVNDDGSAVAAALPRPKALDMQAELAATNAARMEAERGQQSAIERAMAAGTPKDQPKSNGNNQDFLAAQLGANTSRNDVSMQQATASQYLINQGSVIRTVLLSGVNSDLPGSITAQVTSDVYDSTYGRHVLIPKGSRLIGAYNSQVAAGQDRMLMAMNRLILPDGSWIALSAAPATDAIGQSGIEADVNNHFMKMFGTSLVLGMSSLLLPDKQNTVSTTNSAGGLTTGGSVMGMALNDTLKTLLERNKNIQPTLTLKPGQEFAFLVAKDMVMRPYR